ncbi:hypothetical protein BLGI_2221 [Brevibacillus laterosporus GI-9]|nr:hypothetical protein BLGI_2221 [Brevibacillus laterosporus GI-9]
MFLKGHLPIVRVGSNGKSPLSDESPYRLAESVFREKTES